MLKKTLTAFVFLLGSNAVFYAQSPPDTDSIGALAHDSLKAKAWLNESAKAMAASDLSTAVAFALRADKLAAEAKNKRILIQSGLYLSSLFRNTGENDRALKYARTALLLSTETGNKNGRAAAFYNIAVIQLESGLLEDAAAAAESAGEIYARQNNEMGVQHTRLLSADILFAKKEYQKARALYRDAKTAAEQIGDAMGICRIQLKMAEAELAAQSDKEAIAAAEDALRRANELGAPEMIVQSNLFLARYFAGKKQKANAEAYMDEAWKAAKQAEDIALQQDAIPVLHECALALGETEKATAWLKRGHDMADSMVHQNEKEARAKADQEIEIRKRKLEDEKMRLEREEEARKKTAWSVIIAIVLGIIAFFGALVYIIIRLLRPRKTGQPQNRAPRGQNDNYQR